MALQSRLANSRWGRTGGTGLVMPTHQILLTIRETAATLRLSVSTIERMLRAGDLPGVKMNYATRILCEDVDAYIAAHRIDTRCVEIDRVETSGTETSGTETPGTDTPGTDTPGEGAP